MADERPPMVSLVQILADPAKFDERRVAVAGFLSLEPEGSALYMHKDDFEYRLSKNALYVIASEAVLARKQCFDGQYVLVLGKVSARNHGHMGMFSGVIEVNQVFTTTPPSPDCT
jgi:hypothetical protein